MTRRHARAAPGARAVGKVPWGQWERLTVIGALGLEGVLASMSIAAATTGAVFLAFIEQVLIPALRARPDAIVVMGTGRQRRPAAPTRPGGSVAPSTRPRSSTATCRSPHPI